MADDEPTALILAETLLAQLGFEVDTAIDGAECLKKSADMSYDLVILDWQMPCMDGIATLKELRRTKGYQTVPILCRTARAYDQDREEAFAAGISGYLVKPLRVEDFYRQLYDCLPRQNGSVVTD